MLKFASICPHPPIIIPTIGGSEIKKVKNTIDAMQELGNKFKQEDIDKLIVISPHLPMNVHNFTFFNHSSFEGDLMMFGDMQTKFFYPEAPQLAQEIINKAETKDIPTAQSSIESLDHGTLVPLYYLTGPGENDIKLLPMIFCDIGYKMHYKLGQVMGKVIKQSKEKIAVCASGDLSHRLTKQAPAGYSPKGKEFDEKLVNMIRNKEVEEICNIKKSFAQKAGECGLRSIIILLGILDNFHWEPELLSYEGPFGVGYLVSNIKIRG